MRNDTDAIHPLAAITGYALRALDGEIGKLAEIFFDDESWTTRYCVVHTGSWLFGRDVLIAPEHVRGIDCSHSRLDVDLTREQVEGSPLVGDERPVSRHYEARFARYYELAPYWETGEAGGAVDVARALLRSPPVEGRQPDRPHLRSSDEVRGYRIHATDGVVGHVEDFLIAERDWRIRFVEVDMRSGWGGRHVLVAPAWIDRVSWQDREVFVSVPRASIETAPDYDPSEPIGPDDEIGLFEHYGRDAASH